MEANMRREPDPTARRPHRPLAKTARFLPPGLSLAAAALAVAACGGDGPMNGGNGNGTLEGLDLEVGEIAVREAEGEVLGLELPAGSEGRVYDVAAQVDGRGTGLTSMRITVEPGSGASGSVAPSAGRRPTTDRAPAPVGFASSERWTQAADLAGRLRIQESAKRLLRERNVRPARPRARSAGEGEVPGPRLASRLPDSTPSAGDTIEFWYPVQDDFSISCSTDSAEIVTAEVKAVGQRAIMVEDTAVDEDLLQDPMNYDSLATAFDEEVFGTDEAYFGKMTDIDGNGRTYALFTTKVNGLTENEEEGIVTGFFLASDLADSGDTQKDGSTNVETCDASNEAEVLYLLAPDPNGDHGPTVEVDRAKRSAGGTSAHEFQHLLNAGNRLIKQSGTFGDLEETWLDEALSHLAEEVVGLGLTGDPIRSNLTIADVTEEGEVDVFNTFHISNFGRLAEYMLSPEDTRALAFSDPQGVESLKMRGFAWIFLRWVADQEATASAGPVPGSGEEALIRELAKADGGLETGVDNIEAVTGRSFSVLLEDFGLVPAVDDTVPGVTSRSTLTTWNLPNLFLGLHEGTDPGPDSPFAEEYPLEVTENAFAADTLDFEVRAATQKYLRFDGSGASGSVVIRLSDQAGEGLDASSGARLLVVRRR